MARGRARLVVVDTTRDVTSHFATLATRYDAVAKYFSTVYREVLLPHQLARLRAPLQWMWSFAADLGAVHVRCMLGRARNTSSLCAAARVANVSGPSPAVAAAAAVAIGFASPNLGLVRLEKFGFALPPCDTDGSPLAVPPPALPGEEWVEVVRIDAAFYVRSREYYTGCGGRSQWTTIGSEGGPNGCWFLTQRGSGVFVRVGRVLRAANRSELVERLNIPLVRPAGRRRVLERKEKRGFIRLLEDHVPLCPHVRSAGYDTLLLHEAAGREGYGTHELVSCTDECVAQPLNGSCVPGLRTGWDASLPCECDAAMPIVNCAKTGVKEVGPWPWGGKTSFFTVRGYNGYPTSRVPMMPKRFVPNCNS